MYSLLLEKNLAALEKKHDITITNRITVNGSIETIKKMVEEGIGFAILPYYCVHEEVKAGEIKVICDFRGFKDGYQVIITKDKKDGDEIQKFLEILKLNKKLEIYKEQATWTERQGALGEDSQFHARWPLAWSL